MEIYEINEYDFYQDLDFQYYFRSQLPNKFVSKYKFVKILNSCKEEWIAKLNSLEEAKQINSEQAG